MKAILAASVLAVTGAQADAALIKYEYIGAEIEFWDHEWGGTSPGDPAPSGLGFPASGYFTIDTSLLPVDLQGATIDIYMIETGWPDPYYPATGFISNGDKFIEINSELSELRETLLPSFGIFFYSGLLSTLPFGTLSETVYDTAIQLKFDSAGNVDSWGMLYSTGGSADKGSSGSGGLGYDVDSAGTQTFMTSKWVKTVVVPDELPAVPLPASAPLLLAGLAALGILRRKRRA